MLRDNKGSVIVFTAMIIVIMLILASFQIVVGFIFRDQVVILDALD
jgi:Flp pilus assembly protein TadG